MVFVVIKRLNDFRHQRERERESQRPFSGLPLLSIYFCFEKKERKKKTGQQSRQRWTYFKEKILLT